jgi:N-acetylglucosaminyldiphosphoundecaprenol N-acetyl-beta-D-mannosaminyltransferase
MKINARRQSRRPLRTVQVAEAAVNLPSLSASLSEAVERASRGEGFSLFTLNLDHLVKLKASADFRAAYDRADLVSADGWPIVWLSRRMGALTERACGSDMVEPLCEAAAERGLGVYFIGPGPSAQAVALEDLTHRYPALTVSGAETPHLPADFTPSDAKGFEVDALAERINASGARLCFVSMGAPKQELLSDALSTRCPHVGFVCVGAALDFISHEARRAPAWVQRANMEWAWRLAGDPRRLSQRYALSAVRLAELALPALLGRKPLEGRPPRM